jgi:hypothetical protein
MSQQNVRIHAAVRAKRQQHHKGREIQTSIYGRMVTGKIIAVHSFGTIDIELPSGNCFRVSGIKLDG